MTSIPLPSTDPSADHLADLASFVTASPSSFHAVDEAARRLAEAGFARLDERDDWSDTPERAFAIRDGAIIAWVAPAGRTATAPFRIVGAHTDSPSFKLKPKPTIGSNGWLQAGVEVYGAPPFNSWLDRELELAGRLAFVNGSTALVRTGPFLRIPQLAVHLDRAVNSEGVRLDPQAHLKPVWGVGDPRAADLVADLADLAGRKGAEVAGYDIVTADTQQPSRFGLNGALFASGRLDNLASVHAGLRAILATPSAIDHIAVFAAFDHEEVGSESRSGAAGPFLSQVLSRVASGADEHDRARAFASSWCVSADAGHAVHPNYPERHDPANRPLVGDGPLLKINANQRYATDAVGAAEWGRACSAAGVPFQEFVSSNSVPCGSTIGPITATRLGIRVIDVGIPLLSMHSAREMCGADDPAYLTAALGSFLDPR